MERPVPMRASERQRASGQERPAWPGNAVNVERADGELSSDDGVSLATTTWRPVDADPVASVVVVHGLGIDRSHRSVDDTVQALVRAGFAVVAFDGRGHGASGG